MDNYGTDAGFASYHTARGRSVAQWEAEEVAAARLVASEFLDSRYVASFPGTKVGQRLQVREWPRTGGVDRDCYVIPADVIPTEIENATYEAALRQLQSPGALSVDWSPNKYKRVSIDAAISVDYNMLGSASDAQTQFMIIDQILAPILTGSGHVSSFSGGLQRV